MFTKFIPNSDKSHIIVWHLRVYMVIINISHVFSHYLIQTDHHQDNHYYIDITFSIYTQYIIIELGELDLRVNSQQTQAP